LQLLTVCGLAAADKQRYAGRHADIDTLRVAFRLGLPRSESVAHGVADSADLTKLIWLRTKQHCHFPYDISATAAAAGSVQMLHWLKKRGFFPAQMSLEITLAAASRPGNIPVLHYLHEAGATSRWHSDCCGQAGATGDVVQPQWLCDHGAPLTTDSANAAASGGSVPVFEFMQQQGVAFTVRTLEQAAYHGQLQLCQWLRTTANCQWSSDVLECAAYSDSVELVRWLLDSGCECDLDDLYRSAAETASCSHSVLRYLVEAAVHAEPERLTATLDHIVLDAMKLLRQHGAAWPDTLYNEYGGSSWSDESVAWARAEGCTAPTEMEED
jgi:hypothetical protein